MSAADLALTVLLWILGQAMRQASRFQRATRSQVTRTFTVEVSAGERVVRQWLFCAADRRISTRAGRSVDAEHCIHFATSGLALRELLSPRAVEALVDGCLDGRVRFDGSTDVLLWFHGLTRRVFRVGREPGPARPLPGAYLRPDPTAQGAETIIREAAVERLDSSWVSAWEARAQLAIIRAADGDFLPSR